MRRFVTALVFMCVALPSHGALQAGAAKRSIVPPFPTHMGGFGDRMEFFEGVHDDIFARALVLESDDTAVAIIGSDLMALDEKLAADVRQQVERATGIPGGHIMVACAHNHSAPSYYQFEDEADQERARAFFVKQFAEALVEAWESRVPAEAGYANGEMVGFTRNRQQDNEEVIDTQVGVLRVETLEGRDIIAILYNFTGHPVILGSKNLLLSGEFPGAASRAIEDTLGGVAVFTQGACGDVTVHRSGDPFLEIQRLGRAVAGEVVKTAETIRPSSELRLAAACDEMPLRPKQLPDATEARAELKTAEKARNRAEDRGAPRAVIQAIERRMDLLSALARQAEGVADGTLERPETYPGSVQIIQIGDVVLVGVPGELFVEYALELRQRIRQTLDKNLCVVGYANGYLGYIVTPRAMATGGYEASVARVGVGSGRLLTERAVDLAYEFVR